MKQIFDWLREQTGKIIGEVHSPADVVWNNAVKMCITKIDEAEAKWESEVCEWKPLSGHSKRRTCHGEFENKEDLEWWNVCPYCGKPIKISEVE